MENIEKVFWACQKVVVKMFERKVIERRSVGYEKNPEDNAESKLKIVLSARFL